ncbi:hypothetical protein HDV05_005526 [Chytridiales sp. JEL 0842]|nr:hypothetical protein HDV05_005526 [Chytridiales sp. JEL 0842]
MNAQQQQKTTCLLALLAILSSTTQAAYSPIGCHMDSATFRIPSELLPDHYRTEDNITVEKCATWALEKGVKYFGIEGNDRCFMSKEASLQLKPNYEQYSCRVPCSGDFTQLCGSLFKMSLFSTNPKQFASIPGAQSNNPPSFGNYAYVGCFVDDKSERFLRGGMVVSAPPQVNDTLRIPVPEGMTLEKCQAIAEAQQATYFGVENGNECHYGKELFWKKSRKVEDEKECTGWVADPNTCTKTYLSPVFVNGTRAIGGGSDACARPGRVMLYAHDNVAAVSGKSSADVSAGASLFGSVIAAFVLPFVL